MIKTLQLLAVLLTAIAMAGGWAHLLELPNKIGLDRDEYFAVQQIYRGWALLGIPLFGALITSAALTVLQRGKKAPFYFSLGATLSIALGLIVFFTFTFPANQATQNWTTMPQEWETLRRQWEYSHATGAVLYFVSLALLTLSVIVDRR